MRSLNAVPVDQEGTGIHGLRADVTASGEGKAVTLFPEGNRTYNGSPCSRSRRGFILLIKRWPAPIVPVGIAGAFDAWPWQMLVAWPLAVCFYRRDLRLSPYLSECLLLDTASPEWSAMRS